ncbi:MAG: hypothetical protein JSV33_01090 [bacterium]|nr:MAG: hypothetical protein JSV33_01090 [bacterium]
MSRSITLVLCLTLLALVASCIFQNEPLEPNQLPHISFYDPDSTYLYRLAPDSCLFTIGAVDPDGDGLEYCFTMNDVLVCENDTFVVRFDTTGLYNIQGRAYDKGGYDYKEWIVIVKEKANEPPVISWTDPEQTQVACAVGDTLQFRIGVEDDNPSLLQYSYWLDEALLDAGSPKLIHRFMERGDFILRGMVSDGEYNDTTQWFLRVAGFPDTIPPGPIVDLQGEPGTDIGTIRFTWTAPGDDGMEGRVSAYILRTSVFPILTEEDWKDAAGKVGEPVPSGPGTEEVMIARNLNPGTYLYATVRAMDDFFNLSPLGNSIRVLVRGIDVEGRLINALTGEPLADLMVKAEGVIALSDSEGLYKLSNLPMYTQFIRVRDEDVYGYVGDYYNIVLPVSGLQSHFVKDFCVIPFLQLQDEVAPYDYYGNFLLFFKDITDTYGGTGHSTIFKRWNHSPITVFSPPMTHEEMDLQAIARQAMTDWEVLTGFDLFIEVGNPQDADCEIIYEMANGRHHVEPIADNEDGTPAKRQMWIYLLATEVPLSRFADIVFVHELGHILCLDHSGNIGHIMVGGTMPQLNLPSSDEVNVVRIIYNSPHIFDSSTIVEE